MSGDDGVVLSSLANERTHLAWQRTAMSWGGAGAVVTRYFADDGVLRPQTGIGALMLLVGALMWLDGSRRYHAADDAIRAGRSVPVPTTILRAVWSATVLVITAAVAVEIAT